MFGCVITTTDWQLSSWETIGLLGVLGQGAIQFSLKHNYHFWFFVPTSNLQVLRQQHNNFILLRPSACFRTGIASLQPLLPLPFISFLHFRQPFSFWEVLNHLWEKRSRASLWAVFKHSTYSGTWFGRWQLLILIYEHMLILTHIFASILIPLELTMYVNFISFQSSISLDPDIEVAVVCGMHLLFRICIFCWYSIYHGLFRWHYRLAWNCAEVV